LFSEKLQNTYLRLEQKQKEQQEHSVNLETHDKEEEKKFVEQYGILSIDRQRFGQNMAAKLDIHDLKCDVFQSCSI
jgi:hypothetical protein